MRFFKKLLEHLKLYPGDHCNTFPAGGSAADCRIRLVKIYSGAQNDERLSDRDGKKAVSRQYLEECELRILVQIGGTSWEPELPHTGIIIESIDHIEHIDDIETRVLKYFGMLQEHKCL